MTAFPVGPRPPVVVGETSRDRHRQSPGGAIFVPGERRRSMRTLKPEVRLPSSRRDRIQETRGGSRWEGRIEGGGRKGGGGGGGCSSSHRTRAPRSAHPRGGRAEKRRRGRTPVGAGDWREGKAAAAADGAQRLRVSVREEARHLPEPGRRGWPWGRPGDPSPGRWACAGLRVSRGLVSAWGCGGLREMRGCRRFAQGLTRPRPPGTPLEAEERGSGRGPGLAFAPRAERDDVLPRRTLGITSSEPLWTGFKPQQSAWE